VVKLILHEHQYPRDLAIFGFIICWLELGIFYLVRRRKINLAPEVNQKYQPVMTPNTEQSDVEMPQQPAVLGRKLSDAKSPKEKTAILTEPHEFTLDEQMLRLPGSVFLKIDGVNIHYSKRIGTGGPKSPWLVLLHGTIMGGMFSWSQCLDDLLPHVQGILAFDRPGFGLSDRPKETSETSKKHSYYSVHFAKRITKKLMNRENIKQAIFIGHSTGASLSCWFAQDNPEMVQGMVLLAPTNGLPSFIRTLLGTNLAKKFILQLVKTKIGAVTLQKCWHEPKIVPEEVKNRYKTVLMLPQWGTGLWAMSRIPQPKGFSKCLKGIDVPVLMLHGDDDSLVGYAESVRVRDKFPEPATLKKIPNCGHLSMEECPEVVCSEILQWMSQQFAVRTSTFRARNMQPLH